MINLTSRRAKLNARKELILLMQQLEKLIAPSILSLLKRQYGAVASAVAGGNRRVKIVQTPVLKRILKNHYLRTAGIFGEKFFDSLGDDIEKGALPESLKNTPREVFYFELEKWAATQAALEVVEITKTTTKILQLVIGKGMEKGKSNRQIATDIRAMTDISSKARATTIARTETHKAAVQSMDRAVASTGFKSIGEWIASPDSRTRPAHLRAFGQKRARGKPFNVGGDKLMYPGDSSLGAKGNNIINCRCVLIYHLVVKAAVYYFRKRFIYATRVAEAA